VAVAALTLAMVAVQSGVRFLRPFAWGVFAAVLVQVLLGFGAWATKYGIGSLGIVAVERSAGQVILRSGHTIGGMLRMMAAVLLAAAVFRARFSPWPASARLDLTPALAAWNNKDSQQTRGLVSTGGAR